jgi:hypothetical protein
MLESSMPLVRSHCAPDDSRGWRLTRAAVPGGKRGALRGAGGGDASFWRILIVIAAIALVLVGVTAAVSHGHAPGSTIHDGCSLCITAHAVVCILLVYVFSAQRRTAGLAPRLVVCLPRRAMECPCWNRPPPRRTFS